MLVSIVMPYWNRGIQLDRTLESIARQSFTVEVVIVPDVRKRTQTWMNPAPLWNEGIERAKGDVLVLQNPECRHVTPDTIARLVELESLDVNFASVMALKQDGSNDHWYCHGEHRCEPWFFCGALKKNLALAAGGFNESFTGYGGEDVDFAGRLTRAGAKFHWRDDVLIQHQWHEFTGGVGV